MKTKNMKHAGPMLLMLALSALSIGCQSQTGPEGVAGDSATSDYELVTVKVPNME